MNKIRHKSSKPKTLVSLLATLSLGSIVVYTVLSWRAIACRYLYSELRSCSEMDRSSVIARILYVQPEENFIYVSSFCEDERRVIVDRIVECPQGTKSAQDPVLAVYLHHNDDPEANENEKDPIETIFINSKGLVLFSMYLRTELKDINGDGLYDGVLFDLGKLNETNYGTMLIVSLTDMPRPILHVGCGYLSGAKVSWSLEPSDAPGISDVVLSLDSGAGAPENLVYVWSETENSYIGPAGGFDKDFALITGRYTEFRDFILNRKDRAVIPR